MRGEHVVYHVVHRENDGFHVTVVIDVGYILENNVLEFAIVEYDVPLFLLVGRENFKCVGVIHNIL